MFIPIPLSIFFPTFCVLGLYRKVWSYAQAWRGLEKVRWVHLYRTISSMRVYGCTPAFFWGALPKKTNSEKARQTKQCNTTKTKSHYRWHALRQTDHLLRLNSSIFRMTDGAPYKMPNIVGVSFRFVCVFFSSLNCLGHGFSFIPPPPQKKKYGDLHK